MEIATHLASLAKLANSLNIPALCLTIYALGEYFYVKVISSSQKVSGSLSMLVFGCSDLDMERPD